MPVSLLRVRSVLLALSLLCVATLARSQGFQFIALGDLPYGPASQAPYRALIDRVNQLAPVFSLHVGDIKSGSTLCSDEEFAAQWAHFQRYAGAVVYTPGDNEWTDCHRVNNGAHDPLERLNALRQRFFTEGRSLGQRPIAVENQSRHQPAHARYVENQRWQHQGVVFATFHTVGLTNGFHADSAAVRAEAQVREAANSAWIADSFALAQRIGARALVLATQAESLAYDRRDGPRRASLQPDYPAIAHTLLPLADAAPHPVLLVHGDAHVYTFDQPFETARGRPVTKLWRLQVFGEPQVHAVQVRVQPAVAGAPFACTPVWNPMSTDPRRGLQRTP
jgi:hypothetical protein